MIQLSRLFRLSSETRLQIIELLDVADQSALARTCKAAATDVSTTPCEKAGAFPLFFDVAKLDLESFKVHLEIFFRDKPCHLWKKRFPRHEIDRAITKLESAPPTAAKIRRHFQQGKLLPFRGLPLRDYVITAGSHPFIEAFEAAYRLSYCEAHSHTCQARRSTEVCLFQAVINQNFSSTLYFAQRGIEEGPDAGASVLRILIQVASLGVDATFLCQLMEALLQTPAARAIIDHVEPLQNMTPLEHALNDRRYDVVAIFLNHGVHLNPPNLINSLKGGYGDMPFLRPDQQASLIELFRKLCRESPLGNQKDLDGNTHLHMAACLLDADLISALLALGADPLTSNRESMIPLETMVSSFHDLNCHGPILAHPAFFQLATATLSAVFPEFVINWPRVSRITSKRTFPIQSFHLIRLQTGGVTIFDATTCEIQAQQDRLVTARIYHSGISLSSTENSPEIVRILRTGVRIHAAGWRKLSVNAPPEAKRDTSIYLAFSSDGEGRSVVQIFFSRPSQAAESLFFLLHVGVPFYPGKSPGDINDALKTRMK